jgi:methionine-rich copper-binding protein CopC
MRRSSAFLFARSLSIFSLVGALVLPAVAVAHAHLRHAEPAADSQTTSVSVVSLQFSEAVNPELSRITVQDREDHALVVPSVHGDPAHPDTLILNLASPLAAGQYSVVWSVVAADGHRMKGQYRFLVSH